MNIKIILPLCLICSIKGRISVLSLFWTFAVSKVGSKLWWSISSCTRKCQNSENTYMTSAQDSFWTVLHVQKESCVAVLVEGRGGHPGSSVTHIWKHSGGGWLLSWSRVPANCPVGIGHTHMHTQKIYCVCPGEVESCNAARSGCGWQTDWQAGRHDDPLSWNESVHRRHSLHRPRLSVCPSPCLFPLSHQLFLPSLTLWLAPSVFFV